MVGSSLPLNKSDFLRCGLDVLATDGPRNLTAARMARELQVTTGSFYWHFDSVKDFRDELLTFWRDAIVVGIIIDAKKQAEHPGEVLNEIGRIIRQRRTDRYDTAMRKWAKVDRRTEKIVRSADALRAKLIAGVLSEAGDPEEVARDRANLLGAAWRGSVDMGTPEYRLKLIEMITRPSNDES